MENGNLPFGKYIKRKREELQITLRGFAAEIEISPTYLHDIENGNRRAPEKFLERIANALKIQDSDELNYFYDLAGVSHKGQHKDINTYMDRVPAARVALRTAKDADLTDADWQQLIELIKEKKKKQ